MDFQAIFNKVFTEEKVISILEKVATQAENGNLKAVKMVLDYIAYSQKDKNGQIDLFAQITTHQVNFKKYGRA